MSREPEFDHWAYDANGNGNKTVNLSQALSDMEEAGTLIATLTKDRDELVKALEPFAATAERIDAAMTEVAGSSFADNYTPSGEDVIPNMGAFRNARTTLARIKASS